MNIERKWELADKIARRTPITAIRTSPGPAVEPYGSLYGDDVGCVLVEGRITGLPDTYVGPNTMFGVWFPVKNIALSDTAYMEQCKPMWESGFYSQLASRLASPMATPRGVLPA